MTNFQQYGMLFQKYSNFMLNWSYPLHNIPLSWIRRKVVVNIFSHLNQTNRLSNNSALGVFALKHIYWPQQGLLNHIVHHDFYNHLEFIDLNAGISPWNISETTAINSSVLWLILLNRLIKNLKPVLKMSMANRIEPFLAINIEPLFQRKITYLALISVDSFPLPA